MSTTAYTYDDKAMREDLLDILTNISPKETQLLSGLGQTSAKAIRHEWLEEALSATADNAHVEGADATYPTLTNPVRLVNYTQIFKQAYKVTDTEEEVDKAGFDSRKAHEEAKAMAKLKNDIEYALMRGSLASGSGSAARRLQGLKNWMAITTTASGVSLTETALNDYMQNVWSEGTTVNAVYGGMYMKRKISGFTGGATKNVDVEDRRLTNAVEIYECDAAPLVKLFAHRYVTVSGDTNYDLVGVNEDLLKVAFLRKPKSRDLAKTGDATNAEVLSELTLECLATGAGFTALQQL